MCSIMGYCGGKVDLAAFQQGFEQTVSRGPDDSRVVDTDKHASTLPTFVPEARSAKKQSVILTSRPDAGWLKSPTLFSTVSASYSFALGRRPSHLAYHHCAGIYYNCGTVSTTCKEIYNNCPRFYKNSVKFYKICPAFYKSGITAGNQRVSSLCSSRYNDNG